MRKTDAQKEKTIIDAIKKGLRIKEIMNVSRTSNYTIYRIAKENNLKIKKKYKRLYSVETKDEIKSLLKKGFTKKQISLKTGVSLEYLQNYRAGKNKPIKIEEDLNYLKNFLSEFSDVEAVKYQNIIRRTVKPLQENIVKVGLKKFKAQTVIDIINELTPHYYCDFWR